MLVATTLRLAILDKKVTKLTKSSQSSVIRLTRVEKLVQKSITDSNKAPATPAQLRNTPSTLSDSNAVSAPKLTKLFATVCQEILLLYTLYRGFPNRFLSN